MTDETHESNATESQHKIEGNTFEPASTNGVLSKDAILAARGRLKTERLYVPELGGELLLREMTAKERDGFEAGVITGKGKNRDVEMRNLRVKLLIRTIVDEQGNRIFSDADLDALGELPSSVIDPPFVASQRLNGWNKEDIDEIVGNSESVPSDDSPSASPSE